MRHSTLVCDARCLVFTLGPMSRLHVYAGTRGPAACCLPSCAASWCGAFRVEGCRVGGQSSNSGACAAFQCRSLCSNCLGRQPSVLAGWSASTCSPLVSCHLAVQLCPCCRQPCAALHPCWRTTGLLKNLDASPAACRATAEAISFGCVPCCPPHTPAPHPFHPQPSKTKTCPRG